MSQIIPLGIGSPADIKRLVLTGLSPGVLPPPPVPGSSNGFGLIGPSQVVYSFNNTDSAIFTLGTTFILPTRAIQVTWQISYESAPSNTNIVLQVSLDGLNWSTIDETTATGGEIRTIRTSAIFIRAAMLEIEPGIPTTVTISVEPMEWLE
jgi:hypothetical protein